MIRCSKLCFSYDSGSPVIGQLSLEINSGEVHCILGPNGSGKTTLLKLILGYVEPDSGEIYFSGRPIGELDSLERSRLMAYVPQGDDHSYNYSVIDAVLMGRAAGRPGWFIPRREDELAAESVLSRLEISHLARRLLRSLSGGEQQMVSIARSLCAEPSVLILDEPESHLDPARDMRLHRILADLASDGITVVLTSHNPLLVSEYADQVSCLHRGSIVTSGLPAEVLTAETLGQLYGIPYREINSARRRYPLPDYRGLKE